MSLPTWIGSRFCVPLVLTLGHFLWQATAVVLLATAAGVALRRATPRVRYGLFVLALLLTAAQAVVGVFTQPAMVPLLVLKQPLALLVLVHFSLVMEPLVMHLSLR